MGTREGSGEREDRERRETHREKLNVVIVSQVYLTPPN